MMHKTIKRSLFLLHLFRYACLLLLSINVILYEMYVHFLSINDILACSHDGVCKRLTTFQSIITII
jgi:hypothetical protein